MLATFLLLDAIDDRASFFDLASKVALRVHVTNLRHCPHKLASDKKDGQLRLACQAF